MTQQGRQHKSAQQPRQGSSSAQGDKTTPELLS
jgi:hypothetical protein